MSESSSGSDADLSRYVGIGAALVFASYMLSPVLPSLSISTLLSSAFYGTTALVWFYRPWVLGKAMGWLSIVVGTVLGLLTWALLYSDLETVRADANANDRRCLAIQRDMLSARPRRSDGPDLFSALGCRPQGEGGVHAPPRQRS